MTASKGAVKIALRPVRDGARYFESGDQFDPATSSLDERQLARLVKHKFLVDFSPEAYRIAISKRPGGTIGRGWTLEFLYAAGALQRPEVSDQPGSVAIVPKDGDETYLGYILRCRRISNFIYVTVLAPNGERMADKEFRSPRVAKEAIEAYPVAAITIRDQDGYDVAYTELEALMGAQPDTGAGRRLVALATALEDWEKRSTDSDGQAIHGAGNPEDSDDRDLQSRAVG